MENFGLVNQASGLKALPEEYEGLQIDFAR